VIDRKGTESDGALKVGTLREATLIESDGMLTESDGTLTDSVGMLIEIEGTLREGAVKLGRVTDGM
jgi:hypothetical protein